MSYVRIDYKGSIKTVSEENLSDCISNDKGVVLIVTGRGGRSRDIYDDLKLKIQPVSYSDLSRWIKRETGFIQINSAFDWRNYMGVQLSSAYIHRDASVEFLCQILSKCRLEPKLF